MRGYGMHGHLGRSAVKRPYRIDQTQSSRAQAHHSQGKNASYTHAQQAQLSKEDKLLSRTHRKQPPERRDVNIDIDPGVGLHTLFSATLLRRPMRDPVGECNENPAGDES